MALACVTRLNAAKPRHCPNIDLDIAEGEFVAFLGPTGCGKSSLLRMVSDLVEPTSGTVSIRGGPAIAARRLNEFGFVFQDPALLSWRTAIGNVRLPLEVVGYPAHERQAHCEACSIRSAS